MPRRITVVYSLGGQVVLTMKIRSESRVVVRCQGCTSIISTVIPKPLSSCILTTVIIRLDYAVYSSTRIHDLVP